MDYWILNIPEEKIKLTLRMKNNASISSKAMLLGNCRKPSRIFPLDKQATEKGFS